MKLVTPRREIDVTSIHTYVALVRREVFLTYRSGLPFWFFSRDRSGADLEVWAFGVYIVVSARSVPPR